MKKFEFSLRSVLNIKLQKEQLVNLRLLRAKQMLDLEEQKLKELKQEVTACQAEFSERAEHSMQPGHGMAAFVGRMNSAIAVQKNEILQRQSGYDNIRLEKMIHTQRINGLRKLEEDEWAEFETEQNRKQQNELLDVVLRSQLFS